MNTEDAAGIELRETDVHIWHIDLTRSPVDSEQLLQPDEIARANRYHFAKDRTAFVAARCALRKILCRYLSGISPQQVRFLYGENGKPSLAPPSDAIQFNLSHSKVIGLCAVTRLPEIGIDIEFLKPDFPALDVAQRFFTSEEQEMLRSCPTTDRPHRFYRLWTAKEAVMKACGEGMSLEPANIAIDINAAGQPTEALVDDQRANRNASGRWEVTSLPQPEGYIASLATRQQPFRVTPHQFSQD